MANQHYISKAQAATGSITGLSRGNTGNKLEAKNSNPVKVAPNSATGELTRQTEAVASVAKPKARNIT